MQSQYSHFAPMEEDKGGGEWRSSTKMFDRKQFDRNKVFFNWRFLSSDVEWVKREWEREKKGSITTIEIGFQYFGKKH